MPYQDESGKWKAGSWEPNAWTDVFARNHPIVTAVLGFVVFLIGAVMLLEYLGLISLWLAGER